MDEIVPITTEIEDKEGNTKTVTVRRISMKYVK